MGVFREGGGFCSILRRAYKKANEEGDSIEIWGNPQSASAASLTLVVVGRKEG